MDKKEHIIEMAIKLFAEKGFEGTSIRELATQAGVNIAMINYYFGSKEKLFESIVEYKAAYMREVLQDILANNHLSAFEKVEKVIEAYVNRLLSNTHYHKIIHQELLLANRPEMKEKITHIYKINSGLFQQIIHKGIDEGGFKQVNAGLTMATLIGTINQTILSKSLCSAFYSNDLMVDPQTDEIFKQQLIQHLKQVMNAHLLIKN